MCVPYAEVIGDPIAHSKSPLIHKFWLERLGLDYDYRSQRVSSEELPAYFEDRRRDSLWCGTNLTIPHKQVAITHLDALIYPAASIGAVNVVTREGARKPRLIGHNTDAPGFLDTLPPSSGSDRGVIADLIGTGGAAAAVAWGLRREGIITFVYSRSTARGRGFLQRQGVDDVDFAQRLETLANAPGGGPEPSDCWEILVNASPLGMRGFPPLEINLERYSPRTLVYDLVYDPVETPLLRAARERGHPVIGGLDMLIAQAARAFTLFFAAEAPRRHDEELRELLTP